jgi:hypothetical protein
MEIETNSEAVVKHAETISALLVNHDLLVVVAERQTVVLQRLAKINGTVQDYNEKKDRFIQTCNKVDAHVKEHETFSDKMDDKYIGKRLFVTLSIILGVLITALGLLNYLKGFIS